MDTSPKSKLGDEFVNHLRFPRHSDSVFVQADWDLCLDIEECIKKSKKNKESDNGSLVSATPTVPTLPAKLVKSIEFVEPVETREAKSSPRGTRRPLLTLDSEEGSFTMSPPMKKARVDSVPDSCPRGSYRDLFSPMSPRSRPFDPIMWFSTPKNAVQSVQPVHPTPEKSSTKSSISHNSRKGSTGSSGRRSGANGQDFIIYEDNAEDEISNQLIMSTSWFPIFADNDKENKPVEYSTDEEDVTEVVVTEAFEDSQTRRSVLGEIHNDSAPELFRDDYLSQGPDQVFLPADDDYEDDEIIGLADSEEYLLEEYYAEDFYIDEYDDGYATDGDF
ncbi:hypothetical protein BGW36DRAFT_353847 [Talaromyces proteolyticus]|uniref:Uncharacterized protein n=1 Tax=Talaromyces proteolyticus TaxID=1131652 RepID=A0AAD4L6E3_9EURO|nr:uncharacterized protein BGW36DRAFT_353847 [Talaromyces proteolyticus]KAH8705440.1 hypothetical protein BGW36DRAFT_353847 [Talaromyces proteolyticus]